MKGTFSTRPVVAIATQNGTTASVAIIRIPLAAGTHTVEVSTNTGDIAILGVASSTLQASRTIVVGDLPNQLLGAAISPLASQLVYSADIQADITLLASDGLDVRFAPDRLFMLGTSPEMDDSLHPSIVGQQHMAAAFEKAMLTKE